MSSSIVYCSGLKYTLNCRMRMRITYILYERTPCYAAIAIVHAPTRRHRYRMKLENNQSRGNEHKMEQGQGGGTGYGGCARDVAGPSSDSGGSDGSHGTSLCGRSDLGIEAGGGLYSVYRSSG